MRREEITQQNLNKYAFVLKKYNLGDRKFFEAKFKNANKLLLAIAWDYAETRIRNHDIIKNIFPLPSNIASAAKLKCDELGENIDDIFIYLNSDFDPKKLGLYDENLERVTRNLAAQKYLLLLFKEIPTDSVPLISSIRKLSGRALPLLSIIALFSTPRIIRGLTSVAILTNRIHEKSKYEYRIGAICSDGWKSKATGKGACSHHGGVDNWIYKTSYSKTMEECRTEAIKISWLE